MHLASNIMIHGWLYVQVIAGSKTVTSPTGI
jgi:hypothetical protein